LNYKKKQHLKYDSWLIATAAFNVAIDDEKKFFETITQLPPNAPQRDSPDTRLTKAKSKNESRRRIKTIRITI
jgi:hypothetical protein